jgi:hypothetical protein
MSFANALIVLCEETDSDEFGSCIDRTIQSGMDITKDCKFDDIRAMSLKSAFVKQGMIHSNSSGGIIQHDSCFSIPICG